ncbi:MAG: hypothetical protein FWD31_00635, partial [Planctomycetaceae bacterium]|nr:hypothetical protein [Planctomycetaceae bacterium]
MILALFLFRIDLVRIVNHRAIRTHLMTAKNIWIVLLLTGAIGIVGCEKKAGQTLPTRSPLPATTPEDHPEHLLQQEARFMELQQQELEIQDTAWLSQKDSHPAEAAKMRFEPVRRPGNAIVLAEQERARTGFQPDDDFSLDAAIQMGELLRKERPPLPPLDERAL